MSTSEEKLDRILDSLWELKVAQERHSVILDEHHKRSDNLERLVSLVDSRVVPIEQHVQRWAGVGKAVAILAALAAIVMGLTRIFPK